MKPPGDRSRLTIGYKPLAKRKGNPKPATPKLMKSEEVTIRGDATCGVIDSASAVTPLAVTLLRDADVERCKEEGARENLLLSLLPLFCYLKNNVSHV